MTHTRPLILSVLILVLGLSPAWAQRPGRDDRDNVKNNTKVMAAFKSVVAGPSQSTVRIRCDDKDAALGAVVDHTGFILTKASELRGKIVCRFKDGKDLEAKIVGVEEKHDLAMLKVEASGLVPVQWADSKTATVGNWVVSPGTGDEPISIGVVSVGTRKMQARDYPQTGPNPNSGFLGILLDQRAEAAKISQVTAKTAADKAGLKVDDVIIAVDGQIVRDGPSLVALLQHTKPGDEVMLEVQRGDERLEIKAKLEKRPPETMGGRPDMNRLGSELSVRRVGFPAVLQTDTVIKPTDCGGPLVDLDGKTVGLMIARGGRVESYAIPSEEIQPLLADLKSGKLAPPPGGDKPKKSDEKKDPKTDK
jgi:serine protease Do